MSWNGNISALLALCEGNPQVTDGFPSQRPVTRSCDVFCDLRMNERLSKGSRRRWFEKPSSSLWRLCNVALTYQHCIERTVQNACTRKQGAIGSTISEWLFNYIYIYCIANLVNNTFYIWHCVPNILLWSILCKTVGLPSSTGESERTARRQLHSPTLRCFRGHLCEVAAGRGPLKQSRWAESNWTLPLRSVGVAPSLGRFWLVFAALKLRYVLRRHIILSDSDGNQAVLDCFTVSPGLGGSAK